MKQKGLPTMFLGMNLEHHPETKSFILHQNTYINKVISDFAQHLEKITAITPMQGLVEREAKFYQVFPWVCLFKCIHKCSGSLTAFVDSDWANDTQNYISGTGFVIFFGTSPISWTAKKQKLVMLSSIEAEFVALREVI